MTRNALPEKSESAERLPVQAFGHNGDGRISCLDLEFLALPL